MALDETLILRIQADDAELTVGDLKQGIKDLNKEILSVEKGSEKYNQLVHTLGKARGEFRDIKEEAIAYNPEKRAAAFAQVGTSLAGGFQLATGAMAMMGVESQETQKMLLKVQAATAMAQGVQSIGELGKAFNILKVIIMANPIMTIAVIATTAAAAFFAFGEDVKMAGEKAAEAAEEQEKLAEAMNKEAQIAAKSVVKRLANAESLDEFNTLIKTSDKAILDLTATKIKEMIID